MNEAAHVERSAGPEINTGYKSPAFTFPHEIGRSALMHFELPVLISIGSACVAFLAAIGAWAAVLVNRWNAVDTIRAQRLIGARASRASVVSANRQRWIDALRDDVSEFITMCRQLQRIANAGSMLSSGATALEAEERAARARLTLLRNRIELRTNPAEEDHLALLRALDACHSEYTVRTAQDLREKASAIFKHEWERLKQEASGTTDLSCDC